MQLIKTYGLAGLIKLFYYKAYTLIFFFNSRLIRRPIYIRGKDLIHFGKNLTTGIGCRFDAFQKKNSQSPLIQFGNNVQLNDYVHIGAIEKIIIGDNVLIASKVFISDHNHGSYSGEDPSSPLTPPSTRPLSSKPVTIDKNVWIGEFVSILPGVTIGEGSIIGTMSVVNSSIPPYSIAVGCPAKVVKTYCFENEKWIKK